MGIEWDEKKRQENIRNHGVDFLRAALFFENDVIESEDTRRSYGEPRCRALGRVGDRYFLVAYAWRVHNRRIISGWKVGEDGKRRYQAILAGRDQGDDRAR
jgi:uncharacterized protein